MTSLNRMNDVSHEGVAAPGKVRRWRAFWLLATAFLMTVVDLTIVNVALPTIGSKLHFPESDLQWVVTAYALALGGFLLFGGRAADLLGRRRLFMAGMAIFTGASLACALAMSPSPNSPAAKVSARSSGLMNWPTRNSSSTLLSHRR